MPAQNKLVLRPESVHIARAASKSHYARSALQTVSLALEHAALNSVVDLMITYCHEVCIELWQYIMSCVTTDDAT